MGNQTKEFDENKMSMELMDYYENLPSASHPKTEFLMELARRCQVAVSTTRFWVKYGILPKNPEHLKIIQEMTGICKEELIKQ